MIPQNAPPPRPELDETPPLLGSWRALYAVVAGGLLATILLLWALTEAYQ